MSKYFKIVDLKIDFIAQLVSGNYMNLKFEKIVLESFLVIVEHTSRYPEKYRYHEKIEKEESTLKQVWNCRIQFGLAKYQQATCPKDI